MVTKRVFRNREEWLQYRMGAPMIGGSDVGTIMGQNPYCTPFQYWMQKKQEMQGTAEEERNANQSRGIFKEEAIARMFEEVTGEKIIRRSAQIEVYKNDRFPAYMQVAPDREVFSHGRGRRIGVEVKDTKLFIPALTSETMPKMWFTQIQFCMGIMERDQWYIACEEGGKNLVYQLFDFNATLFDYIVDYCSAWFERYILGDEIPPAETGADAALLWPVAETKPVDVPLAMADVVAELRDKKKEKAAIEKEITALEDQIKVAFREGDQMICNGSVLATYKNATMTRIDAEALKRDYPEVAMKVSKSVTFRKLSLSKTK